MAYVVIPLFAVVVVGGIVFAGASSAITTANADLCSGGEYPDSSMLGTMQEVLWEQGHRNGEIVWDSFVWYRNECVEEESQDPFQFLERDVNNVLEAMRSASAVESYVTEMGLGVVNAICGADVRPLLENTQLLTEALDTVLRSLRRSIALVQCSKFLPIFRRFFHGPACNESVRGLTNVFACLMAISIFGMTILTVRAALYPRYCPDDDEGVVLEEGDEIQKTKSKIEDENEFDEYRTFMLQRYGDDSAWKDDKGTQKTPTGKKDESDRSNVFALATATFETESYIGESWDEEDNESTFARISSGASELDVVASGNIFLRRTRRNPRNNSEETKPLTPPSKLAFKTPYINKQERPETAASC